MIRRTFLQTGALSLLGLSLPSGVSAAVTHRSAGVMQWFRQLAVMAGSSRRTAFGRLSPALQQQIDRTNALLALNGYVSRDSSLFFYPGQPTFCFYPLVLRRASAGLTDLLVPVLAQSPDGSWRQIAALTGYQLEALARASAALAEHEVPLADLLLPVGSPVGASFPTRRGRVVVETLVRQAGTITTIAVQDNGNEIYAEQVASEHSLSVSSSAA